MCSLQKVKKAFFITLLSLPSMVMAQEWYLSATDGVDSNDCTVKETPCKSLAAVWGKATFTAGDSLLLQSGTYDLVGTDVYGTSIGTAIIQVYGGYNADYTKRTNLASKTVLTSSATNAGRLFAFNAGHEQPVVFDGVQFANFVQDNAKTDIGLLSTYNEGAWLKFNNVEFRANKLHAAPAIELTRPGDLLELNNVSFVSNQATGSLSGAVRLGADTRAFLRDVIFSQNTAISAGGALHVTDAKADLVNVTFANNTAVTSGSALYATGSKSIINCTYCSFVSADTVSTNYLITLNNNAVLNIKTSVIAAESNKLVELLSGAQVHDLGYNAFGLNENVGTVGVTLPDATVPSSYANIEANLSDLFLSLVDYYGGLIPSLKPVSKNSSVIDKIPNDVPALQTGTLSSKPFTSLAQAHSALTSYAHYQKTNYQFKIDGQAFFTTVDKDGWVLVAGGDYTKASGAYEEAESITEKSDKILSRDILALPNFVFDEVRITTRAKALDVRSSNHNVISALKNFTTLPNNFSSNDGGWYAVQGAQYILATTLSGDNLTGLPNNGVSKALNEIIYDGYGKNNTIKWMPLNADNQHIEALHKDDSRTTDFNLWVRSSAAYCGGIVNTDQRGLPRPDYVNPNDPNQYGDVRNCDIGSFEWNNGYRLDCTDEDGERPENSITSSQITFCIGDISQITPKGIMDNLGAISWHYCYLLGIVLLWRRFSRVIACRS